MSLKGKYFPQKELQSITNGTPAANKVVTTDANNKVISLDLTTPKIGGTAIAATAAELNAIADLSARTVTLTVAGANVIGATVQEVLLDSSGNAITATIATAATHTGSLFVIKVVSKEPGSGQDHTCTITTGTWNGTNKIATFADLADALVVSFDSQGNGTVVANTGTVSLSG